MKKTKQLLPVKLAETLSQHFYHVGNKVFPSVTTILNYYPQSAQLTRWIADQGWSESQAIKSAAGERGTKVHSGVESLLAGEQLMKDFFSLDEWHRLAAFVDWYREVSPEILASEVMLYSTKYKYAGKADCVAKIGGQTYIIDWKTSGSLYPHFALQAAAYAKAAEEMKLFKINFTACLQLGNKTKKHYTFKTYDNWKDDFKTFLAVKTLYDADPSEDYQPPVLTLPEILKL